MDLFETSRRVSVRQMINSVPSWLAEQSFALTPITTPQGILLPQTLFYNRG